jgi:outer membrane receptor protein involved in Fe transport
MSFRVATFVRLAVALAAVPLAATAADEPADDGLLDEIVVTAQKREESLRDVPLSVGAISGEKLADVGIVRMDDLKAYVPNLQMTETGIANNIYIRGIGSGLNQGFEQSVSLYQDGIYRGRGHQSRLPFLDLARIEVLRGPQPILFGKNAVAGAVNLVAARPTREFQAGIRASSDFENDDTVASLYVSGPINDDLAGRLAVHHRNSTGYVSNSTLGRREPKRDELGARLTLDWSIGEKLDVSWRTETGSYNVRGRQIEIFGETPITSGALAGLRYSQIVAGPVPALPQGQSASASNNVIDYQRSSNGDRSKLDNFESALTGTWNFSNGTTLTSVTGVSNYDLDELCDCDFVGATVFDAGVTEDYTQFSQELRFASPAEASVAWIAGLFIQRSALNETDYLHVPTNSLVVPVLAQAFAANPLLGGTPQSRAALANFFRDAVNPRVYRQNSHLYSAFAQATFSLNEQWNVTAGGRFTRENKFGSRTTRLTAGFDGNNLPNAVLPLFNTVLGIVPHSVYGDRSESNFSPLVNFQYRWNDEGMAYLSWSQGSKSGGFDARSNKPVTAPTGFPASFGGGTFEFADEKATTYELGIKTALGGGRAELNADIFYTDYEDLQTSAFDGAIGFNVGNGSAKVRGAELDGRWRATRDFTLTGSLAYLDFEWDQYNGQCYFGRTPDAGTNCNYNGFTNQLAPKFTGVFGAEYRWLVGDGLKVNAAADLVYSSKYLQSLTLDPNTTQDAYTKLNARVSFGDAEDRWEVAVVARNLTDKTTVSYAGDTPLAARLFSARSYYGFVDMPRSVAVEASLKF